MVPFITSESAFGQNVCELISGVDIIDLDLWVHIDAVEQPIQGHSVGAGYVSHRRTSVFKNHLDDRFAIFKNVEQSILVRMFCARTHDTNLSETTFFRRGRFQLRSDCGMVLPL